MSEIKYTSGPWTQDRFGPDNKPTCHVIDSKGEPVAQCHGGRDQRLSDNLQDISADTALLTNAMGEASRAIEKAIGEENEQRDTN